MAASDRHKDAAQRHGRLAAADIPLQKPVHAGGRFEVGIDVVHRALLPLGEVEREPRGKCRHFLGRAGVGKYARILLSPFDELEGGNEDKILLERNARGGPVLFLERLRVVHGAVGLAERRKGILSHELRRDRRNGQTVRKRLSDRVPHALLGQSALESVHGHDALQAVIFLPQLEGRVDHGRRTHAVTVGYAAVKEVLLTRVQVVFDIGRVEPHGGKPLALLVAPDLDKGAAAVVDHLRLGYDAAGDERHVVVVAGRDLLLLR